MKKFLIFFSLGAFASLSMAPFNFWPSLFVGLSALYICITRCTGWKKSALLGFSFSFGYFCFGLSWIGNALLVEGNPYWWIWPLAVCGLPLVLSLFTALSCALHKILCKESSHAGTYISFVTFIFFAEYARGHLFTGFPWNLYGYTWIDIRPIAQVASLWNIYLLSLLTILWATIPAFVFIKGNKYLKTTATMLVVASFFASYLYGFNHLNTAKDEPYQISVVLVQPNIKQSEKWKPENRASNFLKLINLSKFSKPLTDDSITNSAINNNKNHLIVWPETAISQDLIDSPWVTNEIKTTLNSYPSQAFLITGALRYNHETQTFYNSILVFNNNGEIVDTYDKSHLVPFGEYIPFSNIFDIAPIVGFKGFVAGQKPPLLNVEANLNIGAQICYEVIFPNHFKKLSNKPKIIVNVTNDAWYGDSAGPYQHLVKARFRAIESNAPLIRSANTGISAIITSYGDIQQSIALNNSAAIENDL